MSKTKKQEIKIPVETVYNLKTVCRILVDVSNGCRHWKVDCIWPVNLYIQGIDKAIDILRDIIFNNDVSLGHINDK